MTPKDADAIADVIHLVTEPLFTRIKALEAQVAELRASKAATLTADLEHRLHQIEAALGIHR